MSDITRLLNAVQQGDTHATEQLFPLVYEELRKVAAQKMSHESPGQTLQPTALVHEAWLRLSGNPAAMWQSRGHFFAAAAEAMRRILIENARRKKAIRHGGGQQRVDLTELEIASETSADQLIAVDDALGKFALQDNQKANLVKLRYFAGLTLEEAAQALEISVPTAKRWWTFARAWLYREIQRQSVSAQA